MCIRDRYEGVFEELLDRYGNMPLPPYITKRLEQKERYQTVYAKEDGSAAAPTAGLHFTPELLKKIEEMGVAIVKILLHVGLGTFRPMKEETVEQHVMHSEYYSVSPQAAEIINAAKREGRRVIAVGTTSVRTLESAARGGLVQDVYKRQAYMLPSITASFRKCPQGTTKPVSLADTGFCFAVIRRIGCTV